MNDQEALKILHKRLDKAFKKENRFILIITKDILEGDKLELNNSISCENVSIKEVLAVLEDLIQSKIKE